MAEGSQAGAPLLPFEHQKVSLNSKNYQLNSTEYQNSYKRYCGEGGVERRNALRGERVRRRAGNQWASE